MCLLWLGITIFLAISLGISGEIVNVERELSSGLDVDVFESEAYQKLLPSLEECGVGTSNTPSRVKRVVGGRPIPKKKYPWLAQLYSTNVTTKINNFACGGTFITDRVILTAAHCLTRISPGETFLTVGFGTTERMEISFCPWNAPPGCHKKFTRLVEKVIAHEAYSEANLQNDIGLAVLKHPVIFNAAVQPVCLPYSEELLQYFSSPRVRVAGFGTMSKFDAEPTGSSPVAMEADIYLADRHYCDKFHSRQYGELTGNRFCGLGEAGRGGCNGDSGGPLLKSLPVSSLGDLKRTFQIGMVSSGDPGSCGFQGRPMVFTNILHYMPWILEKLHFISEVISDADESSADSAESREAELNIPRSLRTDLNDSSEMFYVHEISTGLDIDVLSHPNIGKLPTSENCGSIPAPRPEPKLIPSSEEDVMYDAYEDNRVKRITGGRIAGIAWFPFMAQIYSRDTTTGVGDLRCAGMIISSRFILTTASCVTNLRPPHALDYIQVGNFNRNLTQECTQTECFNAQKLAIAEIILHDGFTKYALDNDIALVKVGREITFGVSAQPVCLPLYESMLEGLHLQKDTKFLSAGWGSLTLKEDSKSNLPQHIDVSLRPRRDCENVYTRILGEMHRSRFCGGGESGKGECSGDYGGPLMKPFLVKQNERTVRKYIQFGIISFAECGIQGLPTIYTNVLYYMPWILDHL